MSEHGCKIDINSKNIQCEKLLIKNDTTDLLLTDPDNNLRVNTKIYLNSEQNLTDDIVFIGSGKLGFPDRAIMAFSIGCDMINVAREAMLSLGCIQAQNCHTDHCPTGVATQNKYLQRGLNINHKSIRFAEYIKGLRKEILELSHACGYTHPCQFTGDDIEVSVGINKFSTLSKIMNYKKTPVNYISMKHLFND